MAFTSSDRDDFRVYLDNGTAPVLVTKRVVCDRCLGNGTSSANLGAFTADEMAEQGEDFRDDYRSGALDHMCAHCDGLRVVYAVDLDGAPAELVEAWNRQLDERFREDAVHAAELAFGC